MPTSRSAAVESSRSTGPSPDYDLFFDRSPQPMWILDRQNLAFLAVNEAAVRHYGYARQEFLGMTAKDIRPPEDVPGVAASAAAVMPDLALGGTWRHLKKDGTVISVDVTVSDIEFQGRAARLVAIVDVTERLRIADALQHSIERQRLIIEGTNVGWWDWDIATDKVEYSPAWKRQIGYEPDEIGDGFSEWQSRLHPDDVEPTLAQVRAFRANPLGGMYDVEFRFRHKDGSYRWILARGTMLMDPDGTPRRMLGTHTDITERRGAEQRVRQILDTMLAFVGLFSPEGLILEGNRAVLELTGLSRDEVVGQELARTYPFAYSPDVQHRLRDALHRAGQGEVVRYDEQIMVAGGRFITADAMFAPVRERDGRVAFIVGSGVDITQRKQAEEQLRRVAAGLERAREAERTRIAREIHDELGQALTGLKMDLAWLHKRIPRKEPVEQRVRAMLELLNSTVDTVRRIAGELRPRLLDDLGLAAAVRWHVAEFARHTGIAATAAAPDELTVDLERATAAFRILQEALNNVARHAGASDVAVSMMQQDDALILEVRDNGCGISSEQAGGTSLGLLGMRERAENWGGTLEIAGERGRGTTVTLRLPLGP